VNGLPKLPIGLQTFEEIIRERYLYVDKTQYLIDLIDEGKAYFLSRPRRFGKSLTISTLDAIFSGKKRLFKGLAAEKFFESPKYRTRPVIKLDISQVTTDEGVDVARNSLARIAREAAEPFGVETSDDMTPGDVLRTLIRKCAAKHGPAVILIDEYDKPILDFMHSPEDADAMRSVLRNFYIQIKSADEHIRFVFVTGITKFSKMGVFSGMNNLKDISMTDRCATMLGYTEDELLANFGPHIERAAKKFGVTIEYLVGRIKDYYDGFSFDGKNLLYNPFSTLNFFDEMEFKNYWFESGTPSYIAKFMLEKKLTTEEFRGVQVPRDFAASPGEIESATAMSFLYQSGYLSLRPGVSDDYSLDYPNREVLSAMSWLMTENIFASKEAAASSRQMLRKCLADGDADGVVEEFNRLLASIPYDDYSSAAHQTIKRMGLEMGAGEWLYRSTLLSYLIGNGLDVEAEPHSSAGRADLRINFRGRTWIIEIKVARGEAETKKSAGEAMAQIISRGYAERYDNAIALALAIDDERRRITVHGTSSMVGCLGKPSCSTSGQ
jgi:hypothetical protein